MTARLSVDGLQRRPMLVWVIAVNSMPCGTDGACVSTAGGGKVGSGGAGSASVAGARTRSVSAPSGSGVNPGGRAGCDASVILSQLFERRLTAAAVAEESVRVSRPLPQSTAGTPEVVTRTLSLPAPAAMRSRRSATIRSAPRPPISRSRPPRPTRVSAPPRPRMTSAPAVPTSRSALAVPRMDFADAPVDVERNTTAVAIITIRAGGSEASMALLIDGVDVRGAPADTPVRASPRRARNPYRPYLGPIRQTSYPGRSQPNG